MAFSEKLEAELKAIGEDLDDAVDTFLNDSTLNDELTKKLGSNLTFFGKTLNRWEDELCVPIPTGPLDPQILMGLYTDLANKIQTADHFYALSKASESVTSAGVEIKKSDLVTALIGHYHSKNEKVPAAAVIDRIAESQLSKLNNLKEISRVVRDYWKNKVITLKTIFEIVSAISISNTTLLKYGEN